MKNRSLGLEGGEKWKENLDRGHLRGKLEGALVAIAEAEDAVVAKVEAIAETAQVVEESDND